MKNSFVLLLGVFAILQCSPKTTSRPTKTHNSPQLVKAKQAVQKKDYLEALKIYDKLLKKDPNNKDAILGKSGVYYTTKKFQLSKDQLQKIIKLDSNYNPELYYSLGLINEQLELYSEAATNYTQYLEHNPKNHKHKVQAEYKQKQLIFIANSLDNPVPYQPIKLGENINTTNSEYWAVMSADNSSFVFTRRENHQEDLYMSRMDENSQFSVPHPLSINTEQNDAAHCISPDGKLIIFTRCDARDSKGGCDLYYTQLKSGKWSEPRNMGHPINSISWDAQPSLSSNGKTLYFSSKRKGTHGGADIFISHLSNRKWSKPKPLGLNINTDKHDESPYLHPDGQTLYFRSDGKLGMGGFDIFYAKKDPLTQEWGPAINIGYPINTKGSDGALTVAYDGETAYYATDYFSIKDNVKPNLDIVSFKLYKDARSTPVSYAKLHIVDAVTSKPIKTKVLFYDITTNQLLHKAASDQQGNLMVSLVTGKEYLININEKKYSFYSNHINLSKSNSKQLNQYQPELIEVKLDPISIIEVSKSKEIILNNIFFESGASQLLNTSMIEINNLKTYLDQVQTMKIKILGHTDNIGSNSDNLKLSNDRAKSVYEELIQLGITASRLSYEGMGESKPIADNNSTEGKKLNRRTSFVIISK